MNNTASEIIPLEQEIQIMVHLYKLRHNTQDIEFQIQTELESNEYKIGTRAHNNVLVTKYIIQNLSKSLQENTLLKLDEERLIYETEMYLDSISGKEWDLLILKAIIECAILDYSNPIEE